MATQSTTFKQKVMSPEATARLILMELEELREFKERVLPHLEKYIQLMHLIGNHTAISGIEIYLQGLKK